MKTGDLIFTTDSDFVSRFIRWATGGEWSHVAIAVNDWLMVEAVLGVGVRLWPLANYIEEENTDIQICTVKASKKQIDEAVGCALYMVGKKYSFLAQAGVLFKLLCSRYGVPFISFEGANKLQDTRAMFCSKMVGHCFGQTGIKFTDDDISYLVPQEIADSEIVNAR